MNFQIKEGLSKKKKGKAFLAWTQLNMSFTFLKSTDDLNLFVI